MAITDITDKILSDAVKEAEYIIANAEQKVREMKKHLELSKKEITDKQKEGVKKNLLENEKKITSVAYQEVKRQTDNVKRNLVDETFNEALLILFSLSEKDYGIILKKLLTPPPKDISSKIITPKEKIGVTKKILNELHIKNSIISTDKFKGGVIITGDNFEYNLTFENLIANKKKSLEVNVAKILFT